MTRHTQDKRFTACTANGRHTEMRSKQSTKEDIRACIDKFKLTKTRVAKRAEKVDYVGRDETYKINLKHVLGNFFQ